MAEFEGLGEALRALRLKSGLKQSELADMAEATPAMLSSYETGKKLPALPTLERLLAAMQVDRFDLVNSLEEANGRPRRAFPYEDSMKSAPGMMLLSALDIDNLTPEEEKVFLEMLHSFGRWLKLARTTTRSISR
ncbi:MAG: helix-turn-helix transcriptional regulator [Acidobacteriota bacterium]